MNAPLYYTPDVKSLLVVLVPKMPAPSQKDLCYDSISSKTLRQFSVPLKDEMTLKRRIFMCHFDIGTKLRAGVTYERQNLIVMDLI